MQESFAFKPSETNTHLRSDMSADRHKMMSLAHLILLGNSLPRNTTFCDIGTEIMEHLYRKSGSSRLVDYG